MTGYNCRLCGKNCAETELAGLGVNFVPLCESCFFSLNLDRVYVQLSDKIQSLENLNDDLRDKLEPTYPPSDVGAENEYYNQF